MEEYKALREEIITRLKHARTLETGAVLAIGVVYAWLAKTPSTAIDPIGWWVPVLFPLFGLYRHYVITQRSMEIAEYIRSIEEATWTDSPRGWETFLAQKRNTMKGISISLWPVIFWITLLIVTVIGALTFTARDVAI